MKSLTTKEINELKKQNAKLKAENAKLKQQVGTSAKPKRPKALLRKSAVIALVSLAVALLTVANLLFWFGNTVVKHDRFVAAVHPIVKDPVVQDTIALYTTNQIFSNVDVQSYTEQVLPPRADFLAPQLTSQLKTVTQSSIKKVLAKPSFQEKWNNTLSRQHERLVSFAADYKGNGNISLNDAYNQLSASLSTTKLSFLANKKLPSKVGDITVVNATWLPAFHNIVANIDTWRLITALLLVASVVGAVFLSRNRRRTIYTFSAFTAVLMLVTLVALHITRDTAIGKVDPLYQDGVRRIIQIVFHSLVLQTVTIMATAIFISLITWISGPSRGANSLKKQVSALFSGKLHEQIFSKDYGWNRWVREHKRPLEWGSVIVIAALMLTTRLTIKALILYGLLMLVAVLVIEVIGGNQPATTRGRPKSS
ncbi:septum formation initiator family protein [Candidatus Saccharibacteria bacterium]|nr:septum formation initiator family protein [Candidatus Saccharibacteria bacterium]